MSSQAAPGPPAPAQNTGVSPQHLQQAFDHGIWYTLSLWPALHVAVQNHWGGPATDDKKDWFAGAISDLFAARPDTDAEDLEAVLLQVMQDEFDCNVEDESECEVARAILRLKRELVEEGRWEVLSEVEQRWRGRGGMRVDVRVVEVEQEVEEGEEEEEEEREGVPDLVPAGAGKEKQGPEIDEDGFEKVRRKR